MLKVISDRNELANCQQEMLKILKTKLNNVERLVIGHPGGNFQETVYYDDRFWFATQILMKKDVAIPRYWNGFGLGVNRKGMQTIAVENNIPLQGVEKRLSGIFAKDEIGNYYVLSRGKIGGGSPGIGKNAFIDWYRGERCDIIDNLGKIEEAILIASFNSKYFFRSLYNFVQEVANFKAAVKNNDCLRGIDKKISLGFSPESFGRRKANLHRNIEYESYHGFVVNELEKYVRTKHQSSKCEIFNNRYIDLGVLSDGQILSIYEIKSSLDRQSIYTAIGQLVFHAAGHQKARKILVLPDEKGIKGINGILNQLDIALLTYQIEEEKVNFKEVDLI